MRRLVMLLVLAILPHAGFAHSSADLQRFQFEQHLGRQLPSTLSFADENAHAVAMGDYFGRIPLVLVMGYFDCPNLCDTALAGVIESLERARLRPGRDYRGLFVSINPREGPQRAAARKREQLGEPSRAGWSFLTGKAAASAALAGSIGFPYEYDPHEREYIHPAGFVIVSPSGTISRYFPGVRFDADEVRTAIGEASRGRVGSLAERLLLLCAHFDPATGKYGALVWNITRGAVLLFALVLAAAFFRSRARGS